LRNWDEVYKNQKIILKTLREIDEIFLAGGTAVQCYLLPKKYRESEDLDFFVESEMSSKESAKLARTIIKTLGQNKKLHSIRHKHTEDGTHRIFCAVEESSEIIKIELLNFTTDRFGDLSFIKHEDFPRVENPYNLLLYKLKALCDRTDTIKDLFDIYFLFKVLEPINLKQMLLDLEFKFLETTGYVYNTETLINALNITRRWDIVLTGDGSLHYAMKEAIVAFQNDFATQLLLAPEELDFSYERYVKEKMEVNGCNSLDDYLSFFEENAFLESEIKSH
jgi:predicted nucleotidyltransferase component of viral defense system